jgi:hypothetical protein
MSTQNCNSADQSNAFDLELYKALKAESASYFEKLQALWLQKFILMGAIIAFVVSSHEKLEFEGGTALVGSAIVALPILSGLIDAKILEFSLHVRAISGFIEKRFREPSSLAQWEMAVWGVSGDTHIVRLSNIRSLTTTLVTVVPTMVIILIASVMLGVLAGSQSTALLIGSLICALYAGLTAFSWKLLWPPKGSS